MIEVLSQDNKFWGVVVTTEVVRVHEGYEILGNYKAMTTSEALEESYNVLGIYESEERCIEVRNDMLKHSESVYNEERMKPIKDRKYEYVQTKTYKMPRV